MTMTACQPPPTSELLAAIDSLIDTYEPVCFVVPFIKMPIHPRTRSACDRCHAHKLRCPKQAGSVICARCLKAGARCVYSPPGTNPVPNDGNDNGPIHDVFMDGGDMGPAGSFTEDLARYGWTAPGDVDFSTFLPDAEALGLDGQLQGNYSNTASSPPSGPSGPQKSSDTTISDGVGSGDPGSVCTWTLTSLLRDADQVWSMLPSTSALHTQQDNCDELFLNALSEKVAAKSALETLFALAQGLIDAYPAAIETALAMKPEAESVCNITDCTHTLDVNPALRGLEEQIRSQGGGMSRFGMDLSLASLLVACHTRVLDILDRVFLLVPACDRITLANHGREPRVDLSELRVGAFVPQRTGAMLMQIALLRHLVASLSGRLASFGEAVSAWDLDASRGSAAETNLNLEREILRLQHELLTKRQAIKVTQVGVIEEFLITFDPSKMGT